MCISINKIINGMTGMVYCLVFLDLFTQMMTQISSGQTLGLRITPSQTQGAKAWCQVARGRLLCRWAGPLFLSFLMSFFSLLRRTVSHLSKEKSIRNPLAASVAFLSFSLQGLWVLGSNCKTVRLEQKLIAKHVGQTCSNQFPKSSLALPSVGGALPSTLESDPPPVPDKTHFLRACDRST